jgi:hypothetical protein
LGRIYLNGWCWQTTSEIVKEIPSVPALGVDNPQNNTYDLVKARFEKHCFKVFRPFQYVILVDGKQEPDFLNHIQLHNYYANVQHYEKDKSGAWRKKHFIERWVHDEHIKTVREIVVDPQLRPQGTETGVFNMWNGFAAAAFSPIHPQIIQELVQPIIRHLNEVITDGNEGHTNWLLDYMANIVQRPHQKTQVAISFCGKQGCGKGIIFDFFRTHVLGPACSFQTANSENDILRRFANGIVNKVFIQVDEVKSLRAFRDKFKNLITNDTLNYKKKGNDVIVVKNLTNLIFTSNNEKALRVHTDDRHFVLFRCNPLHVGNTTYFQSLGRHLEQPDVAIGFYQFLMGRDLSMYPYDFQSSRPITEYYKESQCSSIPAIARFFSAKVNSGNLDKISASDLYLQYSDFYTKSSYKNIQTSSSFGREVASIDGVKKKRTSCANMYEFNSEKIKIHLIKSNEYDPEALLEIGVKN